MKKIAIFVLAAVGLLACTSNSIKEKINKAGDIAGEATGEFIEGASKGVEKAFDVDIRLNQNLVSKGIQFGKATITNDSIGVDNLLVLYVIFNQDYKGKLTAKAFDDKNLEMGRATIEIVGEKDETKYVEFHFDKRTNIDSKNKLTVE
jgi:hypothetical protein